LGFPYNIFVTAGASDFQFGAQLWFAKTHHKISRRRKGGNGTGLGELLKSWGSPSIFTKWLKLGTSNSGFPRPTIKQHPEEKCAWPLVREAPIYLGFPFNISAMAVMSS